MLPSQEAAALAFAATALAGAGYAGPLRLVGHGATRSALARSDRTAEPRSAMAGRVDIVIHANAARS